MSEPWVIKLGGSFWSASELPRCLDRLAGCNVVLVPGGGVFADAVRLAQKRWEFDDQLAHAMAISAMAQYGQMLLGLCDQLTSARRIDELTKMVVLGKTVVWLPDSDDMPGDGLGASWDVTSDSLSLWLAGQIGAQRLLLIKSITLSASFRSVGNLVEAGTVDHALPDLLEATPIEVWVCGSNQLGSLEAGLVSPGDFFTRVGQD